MSRQKKRGILNQRKKSKLLTSFLTKPPHSNIKAKIQSTSMSPLLTPGMEVILDSQKPSLGDIVLYYSTGKEVIIAHRIIKINRREKKLLLKGDNRNLSEEIDVDRVIGRVSAIVIGRNNAIFFSNLFVKIINLVLFIYSRLSLDYPYLRFLLRGRSLLVRLVFHFYN